MDTYNFTNEDMCDFVKRQHNNKTLILSDYTWDIDDEDTDFIKESKLNYNLQFMKFFICFQCMMVVINGFSLYL